MFTKNECLLSHQPHTTVMTIRWSFPFFLPCHKTYLELQKTVAGEARISEVRTYNLPNLDSGCICFLSSLLPSFCVQQWRTRSWPWTCRQRTKAVLSRVVSWQFSWTGQLLIWESCLMAVLWQMVSAALLPRGGVAGRRGAQTSVLYQVPRFGYSLASPGS